MHIYEVVSKDAPLEKHVVIAESRENAVRTLVFELNEEKGFDLFITDDFIVKGLIVPNDYSEETVIN